MAEAQAADATSSITMIRSSGHRVTNSLRPSLAVGSTGGYAGVAFAVLPPPLRVSSPLETVLQDALGSQYRLERELEAGGMSRLFLATDLRLKREVVVKVLPPDLVSVASTARFRREIELTVRLQHPHILPILTSGEFEDGLFYITPYIQGESLRARIERERKLPLDDILRILKDVSGALAFAHQRGIVHRDIKPGNILLSDGQAILADFGIARAVSTTATPLTDSGVAPGTPAYMAPELPTDERADVYALGVVAYEMLTGELPRRGMTARQITAARGRVPSDNASSVGALSTLISRTTAADYHKRIDSARNLFEALNRIRPQPWVRRHPVAIVAIAGLAIATATFTLGDWRRTGLRSDVYEVVAVGTADSTKLDVARRIGDALLEWRGPKIADPSTLDAVQSRSLAPINASRALGLAREHAAANLVTIDVHRDADSVVVNASLRAIGGDGSLRSTRGAFPVAADALARLRTIRGLLNSLLRDGTDLPWDREGYSRPPVLEAWRAYDRARSRLGRWDLPGAERELRKAIAFQPDLWSAQIWLAQVLVWRGGLTIGGDARTPAQAAFAHAKGMSQRDSTHSLAVWKLVSGDMYAARKAYASLLAADSTPLTAWIGIGDSNGFDRAIIHDRGSPTGWAFRGSHEAAARAYLTAGEAAGETDDSAFNGWIFARLSSVSYPTTNKVRVGLGAPPDTVRYGAYPFEDHDSIAFGPYPLAEFARGTRNPSLGARTLAVARSLGLLKRAAEGWVSRAPNDPSAFDSLANWLELAGGEARVNGKQMSALDVVRRARALSTDSSQRLHLAITEVRLLLKSGRFEEARLESDSLFRVGIVRRVADTPDIPGLAILIGRITLAAQLYSVRWADQPIQTMDGRFITPAPQVALASARLLVYSASGGLPDSVRLIATETRDLVSSYYRDQSAAAKVRSGTLAPALAMSFPVGSEILRETELAPDATVRAFQLLARGERDAAQAEVLTSRRLSAEGDQGGAIDVNLRRSRLLLIMGDTAAAIDELDVVLRALPRLGPTLFRQVTQVASLVNAFALRAELAAYVGDRKGANQWARVVLALWQNADPAQEPVVRRMRALLR